MRWPVLFGLRCLLNLFRTPYYIMLWVGVRLFVPYGVIFQNFNKTFLLLSRFSQKHEWISRPCLLLIISWSESIHFKNFKILKFKIKIKNYIFPDWGIPGLYGENLAEELGLNFNMFRYIILMNMFGLDFNQGLHCKCENDKLCLWTFISFIILFILLFYCL